MAALLIEDILSDANKDINSLRAHKNNSTIKPVFEYGFDKTKKWILPEGMPPYKEQLGPSVQLTGTFLSDARRFYVFCREDLTPAKRESIFIQMLESISKKEAEILCAIKDQTLGKMYPNITFDKLKEVGIL